MGMLATTTVFFLLCLTAQVPGDAAITRCTADGSRKWGYVQVRPKANMFWMWYQSPNQGSSPANRWPTILWMLGSPGESGSVHGNFLGVGPLDINMNPRNSTWLHKANLIFLDTPVGVGFSYVEDPSALAKSESQAASDVTELFKVLTEEIRTLQISPLVVVGRVNGGRHAVTVTLSMAKAIKAGSLKLTLRGLVLGDSSISPDNFL